MIVMCPNGHIARPPSMTGEPDGHESNSAAPLRKKQEVRKNRKSKRLQGATEDAAPQGKT